MTDDIVTRLRNNFATKDYPMLKDHCHSCAIPKEWGGHHDNCLYDQAADEIERLQTLNTELVKMFKQVGVVTEIWQKTEDELIELHHGICADQFAKQADEIELLRAELKQWQALCDTYYHKLALEPDNTTHFIFGYRHLAAGGK